MNAANRRRVNIYTLTRRHGSKILSVDLAKTSRDAAAILRRNVPTMPLEVHQRRARSYRIAAENLWPSVRWLDDNDALVLTKIIHRCQDRELAHARAAQWLTPRRSK